MIRDVIDTIDEHISKEELMETVKLTTGFHRLQASEGYRNAAEALKERFNQYGISAHIDSYPAAFGKKYLTATVFPEWTCNSACMKLVSTIEETLSDFKICPNSVIQKSFPWKSSTPLDVVLLDKGNAEETYEGLDIKGKVIFIRDDFNAYIPWAIEKKGAVGIVSDYVAETPGVRSRSDMYDVCKYTTFWWTKPTEVKPFGFVVPPRTGDRLADICRKMMTEYKDGSGERQYPQVVCSIDAETHDGYFENLVAEIPGTTKQEVWITAHLCHPSPSANDNSSGVAASIEALRVIHELVEKGKLKPLRHTLKILLVPEFTGTYAHLSQMDGFDNVHAALNLDMVGGDQLQGYGPLTLSGLSLASPSL